MKDFEYYEKKPESQLRNLSELERYEIFNLECAEMIVLKILTL